MSNSQRLPPNQLSPEWPNVTSTDPIGEVARQFALNLRKAMGDRTLREAADVTGVDYSTIATILNGRSWPDLFTMAKLERGLDADLWPGRTRDQ
jgi:hypothetical protein